MVLFVMIGGGLAVAACVWWIDPDNRKEAAKAGTLVASNAAQAEAMLERLDADRIKEELARTGRIVRQKAGQTGAKVADAAADAQITAAIKTKLAVDPDLSALGISVNTTRGVVTLAGLASSHEHIRKAMRLAVQCDGVREVVSTIQLAATASR